MNILHGEGVSRGIAHGTLKFLRQESRPIPRYVPDDPQAEWARFEDARAKAAEQLTRLEADTRKTLGEEQAMLFSTHRMMLEDLDFLDCIQGLITSERINAEAAVLEGGEQFSALFAAMDDPYMRERSADVLDVSRRVIRNLMGEEVKAIDEAGPFVLAADDLAPSETAALDRDKIVGFITAKGSRNAHTAIFARTMGIPAVVGLGDALPADGEGATVYLDGQTGEVFIEPDAQTAAELDARAKAEREHRAWLERFRGQPAHSADGRRMLLCANIGSPDDLSAVLAGDADGVGLFRSEFLYLGRNDFPSEEEQFEAYRKVLVGLSGRPVVVRTLDIGADKNADYFQLPKEENPAMGLRAIRICLTRPEIFRTQLRALYRASAYGNLSIMFPMITQVGEVRKIKEICADVQSELASEGVAFSRDVALGIMVETPAAAIISDLLAPEVDFFSIGTNDLTQYTLAVDRQNAACEPFCDRHHEALLRLIRRTVESAHAAGIWAGICGELAADMSLTSFFSDIGVDELSMSPSGILEIRAKLLSGADAQ